MAQEMGGLQAQDVGFCHAVGFRCGVGGGVVGHCSRRGWGVQVAQEVVFMYVVGFKM